MTFWGRRTPALAQPPGSAGRPPNTITGCAKQKQIAPTWYSSCNT